MERVLPLERALEEVLRAAATVALPRGCTEELLASQGRVLAEVILAERDQPPFTRSTRDGYALHSADLAGGAPALQVTGTLAAGARWQGAAPESLQAIEIMTGAPVPEGMDAVLMVEHARLEGSTLHPEPGRRLAPGENTVPQGAEARAGSTLVPAGRRIGTPEISLAASSGYAALEVYTRPRVAIIATGDELVELDDAPAPFQIRNSNSYALASLVAAEGAVPHRLPIARDTLEDLRSRIADSLDEDLLLFSGGVSMGKYDLVETALREAGARFHFTGALIQPGKPVVFGEIPARDGGIRYFFGLPGNPVSTEVCFRLFVTPVLRALSGQSDRMPRFAEARLAEDIRGGSRVTRFLPASMEGDWSGVTVRPVPWQGSGDLAANGRANSFVVLPREQPAFAAGQTVRVLLR